MKPDEFYVVTGDDVDALRRENELLSFENQYLRSRIAEMQREVDRLAVVEAQLAAYQGAYHDLRWLLRRMSKSPVGPVLDRFGGWQALKQRHLR